MNKLKFSHGLCFSLPKACNFGVNLLMKSKLVRQVSNFYIEILSFQRLIVICLPTIWLLYPPHKTEMQGWKKCTFPGIWSKVS